MCTRQREEITAAIAEGSDRERRVSGPEREQQIAGVNEARGQLRRLTYAGSNSNTIAGRNV
jgi:hypothetical protein